MPDDNVLSRRRFLTATGGAAAAVTIAGCSSGDEPTTETPSDDGTSGNDPDDTSDGDDPSEQSDKVYQLVTAGVNTLDPIKATDVDAGEVVHNIFDGLTNYPNGESAVELLLAEDYESKDDGGRLVFKLKEGVTFSNGDEVTAQDFAYSFERLAASEHSRQKSFLVKWLGVAHETDGDEYVPGSLGVNAKSDYELEIELQNPFHASLEILAYDPFAAIPEGIVGDVEGYDGEMSHEEFVKDPIGAGPYTLEKWEKSTEIKLAARPIDEYHGEGPYTAGTRWKYIEGTNAVYTYMTTNVNADHPAVPSAEYDESKITIEGTDEKGRKYGTYGPLENGITADYYRMPILATYYIGFNTDQVEKPARQAWAYAYNRVEIDEKISAGPSNPAYFFTPPSLFPGGAPRYDQLVEDEYPYGVGESMLDEARTVMEEAGYSEDDRYSFTFSIGDSDALKAEGRLMQDKLKSAHIDLEIKQTPSSTLKEQIRNGNIDAFLLSWWADYPAADNFLQMLYPPNTQTDDPESRSYFNWNGTEAADRATQAWEENFLPNREPTEAGQEARNEAYTEIEKAVWEDVPVVTSTHYLTELFTYPWVDKPRSGVMGSYRQKHNTVRIGDRSE